MRLSAGEISSIKEVIYHFDSSASIFLFGSRTYDTKKGGDIDLLVLSDTISLDNMLKIKLNLYDRIGEQKIDLIVEKDASKPFTQMAIEKGIRL